jgi:hypothetical protein
MGCLPALPSRDATNFRCPSFSFADLQKTAADWVRAPSAQATEARGRLLDSDIGAQERQIIASATRIVSIHVERLTCPISAFPAPRRSNLIVTEKFAGTADVHAFGHRARLQHAP